MRRYHLESGQRFYYLYGKKRGKYLWTAVDDGHGRHDKCEEFKDGSLVDAFRNAEMDVEIVGDVKR